MGERKRINRKMEGREEKGKNANSCNVREVGKLKFTTSRKQSHKPTYIK